jgi:hypothetical protein
MKKISKKQVSKSGSLKMYFHAGTHDAIVRFQQEAQQEVRDLIYTIEILPAFTKLVENLIFIHGANIVGPIDEFKNDCISFLYETLKKFDASRGTKAFSYFNVVAKNWIVVKTRQKIKHTRKHVNIDDKTVVPEIETLDIVEPTFEIYGAGGKKAFQAQQLELMFDEVKSRLDQEHELTCMNAIIEIFHNIDDIDFFNKRAVFVYIREMTNLNTKQISSAMSNIKKHYRESMKDCEFDIF